MHKERKSRDRQICPRAAQENGGQAALSTRQTAAWDRVASPRFRMSSFSHFLLSARVAERAHKLAEGGIDMGKLLPKRIELVLEAAVAGDQGVGDIDGGAAGELERFWPPSTLQAERTISYSCSLTRK